MLPEEIIIGASAALTALAIGPVAEGVVVELLANAAFLQAATKAGAVLGAGKYLNVFGVFKSTRLEAQTFVKHPCQGMSVEQAIQKALELGVDTPKDSFILWSGLGFKDAGVRLSQEFAIKNGGMTLEMTAGGKWLNEMRLFEEGSPFIQAEAEKIWKEISLKAVQRASGQVRAVVGQVKVNSIYTVELKEIAENSKILGVDELQLKPRFTFNNIKKVR